MRAVSRASVLVHILESSLGLRHAPLRVRHFLVVCLLAFAGTALADGKRDLDDGIAFYENLDTERALERLGAASKASDLPAKDRARAFLYLGMVHFENSDKPQADAAWRKSFELDKNLEVPKGTSPKTIEAIELARSQSAQPAQTTPAIGEPKDQPKHVPKIEPAAPKDEPALIAPAEEPVQEDSSTGTWILLGAIGAAVIGAAVVGFVVLSGDDGDCEGGGGCVSVSFR
jgi:hypothetical protein